MSSESKGNSTQSEHGRMIHLTILNLYRKLKSVLLTISTQSIRKYFPTREAKQFCSKIKEIHDVLLSLSDSKGREHFKKLTEFVKALETAVKHMHKQDGISSFYILLI